MAINIRAHDDRSFVQCAYCHDVLGTEGVFRHCPRCETTYHAPCAAELSHSCAILGCHGRLQGSKPPRRPPELVPAPPRRVRRASPILRFACFLVAVTVEIVRTFGALLEAVMNATTPRTGAEPEPLSRRERRQRARDERLSSVERAWLVAPAASLTPASRRRREARLHRNAPTFERVAAPRPDRQGRRHGWH